MSVPFMRYPSRNRDKGGFKSTEFFNPTEIARTLRLAIATDFGRDTAYRAPWQEHFANNQTDNLLKKFVWGVNGNDLDNVTYEKFIVNAKRLSEFNLLINSDRPTRNSSLRDLIIHRARHICHYVLKSYSEEELFESARHSNGATVGVNFIDTSVEAKWTFPVTVTSSCLLLLSRYLGWNQQLHFAVKELNDSQQWYKIVEGSVAATVPKDRDINRFIAKEPTGNMFLQQGAMALMYERLADVGLDLSSLPDTHRQLAWLGSLTGTLGTIDWSQASDCVLTELVGFLFPTQWVKLLMSLRSPVTFIQKEKTVLPMISSMGNATTFPVETLVFWSLAVATLYTLEMPGSNSLIPDTRFFNRVSVFGDDCILPSHVCRLFIETTCSLGFIVNEKKTFTDVNQGFRESCGGDYLHGMDVRPFFLKAPAGTKPSQMEAWLYIIGNSVLKKYISYFGQLSYIYGKAFFEWYFALFRDNSVKIKVVPDFFPDDAGLKIFPDLVRFFRHYEFDVTPIRVSKHGTVRFNYLRNSYPKELETNDHVRYVLQLQTIAKRVVSMPCSALSFLGCETKSKRYLRNDSAYVTASAITCNLTF